MVNDTLKSAGESGAERALALSYAPADRRAGTAALFALDDALASILRTTREPMVGQMRLTWWHDALQRLDSGPPPAEPVLQALARDALPLGITGAALTPLIEGWEQLLEPDPLSDEALRTFATLRGGTLFAVGGMTSDDPLAAAGAGWALIDLARHSRDPALAARVRALASPSLSEAHKAHWSRPNRTFGALAHFARLDGSAPVRRVGRVLWHRMTGL